MTGSDTLWRIAREGAQKIDLRRDMRRYPTFSDVEESAEDEYEQLLEALHEDEIFAPVDLERQEHLVELIKRGLDDDRLELFDDLIDNVSRQVWLHQEAAFQVGIAVGRRMAEIGVSAAAGKPTPQGEC